MNAIIGDEDEAGRPSRVRQEIRAMRFEALLERQERGELSRLEASEMPGMSERTFRRLA